MRKVKIACAAIIAATSLSACGGTAQSQTDATAAAVSEETVEYTEEETTEAIVEEVTTEAETEAETVAIGTPAVIGNWTVTVDNVQTLDSVPDEYGQFNADEGNKYLLISLTAANDGKEADTFMPSYGMSNDISAKVLYGDGYEFTQTQLLGYSKSMMNSTINPLS